MKRVLRKVCCYLLGVSVIAATISANTLTVQAADGLELVRDNTPTLVPGISDVSHDIYFVLPVDSQQVRTIDWIRIRMPNYTDITPASGVIGGFGTPTISLVGTTVLITNLAMLPGTGLNIQGIYARNPQAWQTNEVIIEIAEDSAGVVVRNTATTTPISNGAYVSVSARVESQLSAINLSGFTSPSSFTTLMEAGAVIGTSVADGTGYFSFPINALAPGAHTFNIFSSDSADRSTAITTLSLFLLASSLTTVSNILLTPTIEIDTQLIDPGDQITISGRAKPSSQVNIFLEAPLRSYVANTNVNGDWSFVIDSTETNTMTPGQYLIYTVLQDAFANQSIASPSVTFQVQATDPSNPPPACDISEGDLNCDNVTNLVDFSILLFHWQTNHRVADINSDGKVNLTDFSIMMFYFTR